MARRTPTTDRLIAVLGGVVLTLGALAVWKLTATAGGFEEEPPATRVSRQAKELLGRGAEIQLVQAGRGRVMCGYVAASRGLPGQPFVSRPTRMMLMSDPLSAEFRKVVRADCPDLPHPPATRAVP